MAAILSQPQCVKSISPGDTYVCQWINKSSLVQVMFIRYKGTNFSKTQQIYSCFYYRIYISVLTQLGPVMLYGVMKFGEHSFR